MMLGGVPSSRVYETIMARAPAPPPPLQPVEDKVVEVRTEGSPSRGPARAPVTIVMFSDFECPFCVRSEKTMEAVAAAYPDKTRIVFRQRPLPMHEHARLAAKASLAAEAQGRFWEYHDVLIAHRDALDRASLERYAAELHLDAARFARDLDDPRLEKQIQADEADASALGVSGTPTFFVNGRRVQGAQPLPTFRAAIDRALKGE
jgi:protein-disulfide isomerase